MAAPAAGSTGVPLPCGFGWEGGSGTTWRTNPERGVTGILLTQRQMMSPEPPPAFTDFWAGVNTAAT
jgi:CubicO group peptidase (beta-lactamase class C family)